MRPISDTWCIHIEITNYCHLTCLYCSRYMGHLRKDQREHMPVEKFIQALDSLKGWPKLIGFLGGEPTLHPEFPRLCEEFAKRFPREQRGLWTAGPPQFHKYKEQGLIEKTFGYLAYNEHNPEQEKTCRHHPMTIAIEEVVKEKEVRDYLIDNCWVQLGWCPTINHFGAYFCEVGAAQDILLNEGKHAWPVEEGWWKRIPGASPNQFPGQMDLCQKCGMAVPLERELLQQKVEKFSPELLYLFKEKGLKQVDDNHVQVFDKVLTIDEMLITARTWYPANYREDRASDGTSIEGLGLTPKAQTGLRSLKVLRQDWDEII